MPNPSAVKASDINTELGVSSTLEIKMGNNWVRNVTTQSTGAVTAGRGRWGINFPAGDWGYSAGSYYNKNYGYDSASYGLTNAYNPFGPTTIYCQMAICSNGTLIYTAQSDSFGNVDIFSRTWLTSGSNSDYTARVDVTSGTINGTTGSDLSLSSTRVWSVGGEVPYSGGYTYIPWDCEGNLIIKDSGGTEIFRRPISLHAVGITGF